jgi:hypothetical protein
MPFPNASDHQPISLMFTDSGRTKPASERGAPKVPFVPEWLLADVEFSAHLTTHVESWKMTRLEGLAGIESFNHLVVGTVGAYLITKQVVAKTPQHHFDIVAALSLEQCKQMVDTFRQNDFRNGWQRTHWSATSLK